MIAYTLLDGEAKNREHPTTFAIPARADREALAPGDCAKLVFLSEDGGERMWTRVTRRLDDGGYVGTLANDPVATPIRYGDAVRFGPEHVIDIDVV